MAKTVLVTGGAGFIGSNFVHYLMEKYPDYRILVLDFLTYAGSHENLPEVMRACTSPQYLFWYGDVCNAELVHSLVAEADWVVHFAAETHVTRSIHDNWRFFQTDVLGTQNLANALLKLRHKVERFIHISTSEVYGTAAAPLMDEDHPLNPMSPYAAAKCGADRLIYSYRATYNLPLVIVRPFNNYGPRQHLEKVIPRFVTSALLGEPLNVHGSGDAKRDFIHVHDTCRALDLVLHAPGEQVFGKIYNVASGRDFAILELAREVVRVMGADPALIHFRGDRPGQVFRHTGDASRIRRELGWEPVVPWEEGLSGVVEWYRENRPFWEKQLWMRTVPIILENGQVEFH